MAETAPVNTEPHCKFIKPFGGKNYHDNAAKCGALMPCVWCGKPIKTPTCWAEVIDDGHHFGPADGTADANDPGYMGCYPVGSNCRKRLERCEVKLLFDHGD